jgi:hypothetical protein
MAGLIGEARIGSSLAVWWRRAQTRRGFGVCEAGAAQIGTSGLADG